jgi:hypothetical protein
LRPNLLSIKNRERIPQLTWTLFDIPEALETKEAYEKFSTNSSYISSTNVGKELDIRSAIKAKIAQGESVEINVFFRLDSRFS